MFLLVYMHAYFIRNTLKESDPSGSKKIKKPEYLPHSI